MQEILKDFYAKIIKEFEEGLKESGGQVLGDSIFVSRLSKTGGTDEPVKSAGGIYLGSGNKYDPKGINFNPPEFVMIVKVGPGYYDDKNKVDVPLEYSPGEIVLAEVNNVVWWSKWGNLIDNAEKGVGIGLTYERHIDRLKFPDIGSFNKFFEGRFAPPL